MLGAGVQLISTARHGMNSLASAKLQDSVRQGEHTASMMPSLVVLREHGKAHGELLLSGMHLGSQSLALI